MHFDLRMTDLDLQLMMSFFRSVGNRKNSRAQEQTLMMTCAWWRLGTKQTILMGYLAKLV